MRCWRMLCLSAVRTLCIALAIGVIGCTDVDCTQEVLSAQSPSGTHAAVVEVESCGGATARHVTDLKIAKRLPEGQRYVWTAKGRVPLGLRWIDDKRLEVRYPQNLRATDVIRSEARWNDVEIVYLPSEM